MDRIRITKSQTLSAILSAALLVLSFPWFNGNLLVWIALVPLLFALDGSGPIRAFFTAYLAGALFFLGTIYWLVHVTLPGMIVVVLYLALYFALFGAASAYALSHPSAVAIFIVPAIWTCLEWARSNLLTGFGWVLLGHSQANNPTIIQIADVTGAYGVSFLIVLVNAAIFMTIKSMRKRENSVVYLTIALSVVFLATAYGIINLRSIFTGDKVKVAVIQGNIPQSEKWDRQFREEILRKYGRLTKEAIAKKPDLVIWPETSVPAFIELDKGVRVWLGDLAKGAATPLLVGAPREDAGASGALYNSAILFGPDGDIIGTYAKVHLVPFGEYVPFKKVLAFVERFAPSPIGDFSAGKESSVLSFSMKRSTVAEHSRWKLIKKIRFAPLICFEDIFPDLARRSVANGANFLVNMTNDAWFKHSSAPYQHAASSVFRAVENRVNVIRAANTGYSCFIDQKGEIIDAVGSQGKEIFVEGFAVHDIVLNRPHTIYTRYGDIFVTICALAVAFYVFGLIVQREKRGKLA